MIRLAPALLLVLLAVGPAGVLPANPVVPSPLVNRPPMVQMTTPASAVLIWRTVGPTIPLVRFGNSPDNLDRVVTPVELTIRVSPDLAAPPDLPRLHSAPVNTYQYEAQLTGLDPDTSYYYGIFDDEELLVGCSEDYFVRTQPPADTGRPLRFWVTGDTGDGSIAQLNSFNAMKQFVAGDERPLDAFLHLGDMAYEDGLDSEFQANFFDIYAGLIRNTVVWPTMGNHEGHTSDGNLGTGPYYDAYALPKNGEAGGVPSATEAYYSFNLGPIHFVCLNSYDVDRQQAAAMGTWLQQDLAQNQADWLIAFWHHPPYTKGTHNSDTEDELIEMREQMVPLLEAHGVDFILCGHSHVYERSMLFDGAYATPTPATALGVVLDDGDGNPNGHGPYLKSAHNHPHEGTVAVVAGNGSGASQFGRSGVMRVSIAETGSVLLDLEGDTMTIRMINTLGAVRDECQLIKRGEIAPRPPVPDPWSPFGPIIFSADRAPAQAELYIRPRPLAADAVIHYTLDGSEPTTASPVFNGPVILTEDSVVKAFSTWRGGQRTSPVSMRTILLPPPSALRYLRLPILASEDDASEDAQGVIDLDDLAIGIDAESEVSLFGVRFRDIPIPPKATIVSAQLQFAAAAIGLGPAAWTIHGDLSEARAPFSEATNDLSQRARTVQSVNWSPPVWERVGRRTALHGTPGISPLLQEIINQPNWQSGDPLSFLLSGSGDRLVNTYDGKPHLAAELGVLFDPRDPFTIASDITPVIAVEAPADAPREVFIAFPVLLSASQFGIEYWLEGSPDLTPGSWVSLAGTFDQTLPSTLPLQALARFRVEFPGGANPGDTYFLRVMVTATGP